jgi:hypothetical protein
MRERKETKAMLSLHFFQQNDAEDVKGKRRRAMSCQN